MRIPIDEVVHFDVITANPSTGAVSDADSGPTYDVFEEGTDTPILDDQTLTKRTSLTGNYRGSFTASAANGFEAGKWYVVVASATVGGIAGKVVAMHFQIVPAESVAGVQKVDVSHAAGVAWASGAIVAGAFAANAINAAKLDPDVTTELQSGLATGAALATIDDLLDTEIAAIKAATDLLAATAMTESYAANGAAPTLVQAIFAIHQMLSMFTISGTSLTVKKLDNLTTAFVVTLNHATTPTGAART